MLRGWALTEREPQQGVAEMQRGDEQMRAKGSVFLQPFVSLLLAKQLVKVGQIGHALDLVSDALSSANSDGYWCDAELHRLRTIADATARLAAKRTLASRVAELTRILDEDGYVATSERIGTGVYRIVEHNCAIWAVAQKYGQACTSELDFIRAVLPDAAVERVQHMVAGNRHCAYEIRAAT